MMEFKLWLEFEEVDPGNWDVHNEFANIHVFLPDGRKYGINVWTFEFFNTVLKHGTDRGENLNGLYITPPDLFVKEMTRDCIERTISDLLTLGGLESTLNSSIITRLSEDK